MIEPTTSSEREQEASSLTPGQAVLGPPANVRVTGLAGLNSQQLLNAHYRLTLCRALEERMWQLNRSGKMPFVVPCAGHEGAQVGTAMALRPGKDWVLPYYRDMGVMLVLGMSAREIMLDFMARADGLCSGGRQMPNHWSSPKLRVVSQSSIVGSQIIHATGVALATKIRREDDVSVAYFGDGATAGGHFHEGLNFAGIHKLPVVFVCENNGYAISEPLSKESAVKNVAERAAGYAMPGETLDGMDVLAVYEAMKRAVARARRGEGATLLECKVYRFVPHTSDDDDRVYRPREEVERWKKRDPIVLFRQRLMEAGLLNDGLVAETTRRVQREVDDATDFAERAPLADPSTVMRHVYYEAA